MRISYQVLSGNFDDGFDVGGFAVAVESAIRAEYPTADVVVDVREKTCGSSRGVDVDTDGDSDIEYETAREAELNVPIIIERIDTDQFYDQE